MSRVERLANNHNPHIRKRAWEKWQQSGAVRSIETAKIQETKMTREQIIYSLSTSLQTLREQPDAQIHIIRESCSKDPSIINSKASLITLLCEALNQEYKPEVILELLTQGADPNIVSFENWETLATALNHQHPSEVILALIKAGADKQNNENHYFCEEFPSVPQLAKIKDYKPEYRDGHSTYVLNEELKVRRQPV